MRQLTDKRIAEILSRAEICDDSVLTDYSDIVLAMRELQEHRKAAGEHQRCRSSEKMQVVQEKSDTTHAQEPVQSVGEVAAVPVNGVTTGKPLTITLPDISSKAFWSGSGKNEVFHPETYKRWTKEAIERYCAIAQIEVEVR